MALCLNLTLCYSSIDHLVLHTINYLPCHDFLFIYSIFIFGVGVWQVDPVVYNMLHEDPGNVSYSAVGGLSDQIRELRESIELPLMNPELFLRVGIKPPKVILAYEVVHYHSVPCSSIYTLSNHF